MAKQLSLNGLEIKGFRPFARLELPKLSRVNLIVGKNSVGKTSLLDAVQLFAQQGSPISIRDLLLNRDEVAGEPGDENTACIAIESLFYGRPELVTNSTEFSIASLGHGAISMKVSYQRFVEQYEFKEGSGKICRIAEETIETVEGSIPGLRIKFGNREQRVPFEYLSRGPRFTNRLFDPILSCRYVPANGLSADEIARIWDSIALKEEEAIVYDAIKLVSNNIERLVFVADSRSRQSRIAMVKFSDHRKPAPLRSLGEGTNHLFGLAVSLIAARDGILLVDEIENGLHYSVMTRMWKLIIEQCNKLNVQIIAATHSLDCIKGFQAATAELNATEALLIRLEGKDGNIKGVTFNPSELAIAIDGDIEFR
ncbi:MAG: ATP-binding protein [Rhodospirillaceae bacterium]